ncbi:type II toxin-antitoxin system RelE/ParE family toxin [Comamonas composti]|uniref:type II toxin-antitoxin system RelE/ParE family toxin n=1 Tax=Comamonas composti TaxID=408558 RepID=UPI00047EA21C|nr:type II toxin-antitoxin system RelE/ParE family toxin [Comamonas composti]
MYTVIETEAFTAWLAGLRDMPTRIRLTRRLSKAARGALGDVKPVGDGVWEMREFFGPGWRMYYIRQGAAIIMMLGGGDKSTQQADIEFAKALATELQDEQDPTDQDPPV